MKRLASIVFLTVIITQILSAQSITVQGVLRDPAGRTVVDGSHMVIFRLYDAESGGTELWSEHHGSVLTTHGVFAANLGQTNSLASLSFTDNYWLGIQVDDGTEISQRMQLQSAPNATAVTGSANIVPSTGNVGIGTLNPTRQLEVNGSGLQRIKVASSNDQAGISFESDGAGEATILSPSGTDDIRFYVGEADRVAVTSNGRVGIGTTEPVEALHVAGGSYFEATLRLMNDGGYNEIDFNNTGNLHIKSKGTDDSNPLSILTMEPTGNVGVGTDTPSEKLDVAGNLKISNGGVLLFADGSSLATSSLSGSASAVATPGNALITADSDEAGAGEIQMKTGVNTRAVITHEGNMGINDLLPDAKLSIDADADESLLSVHSSHASDSKIFEVEQENSDGKVSVRTGSGETISQLSGFASTPTYFQSKLGIGTATPGSELTVSGGNLYMDNLGHGGSATIDVAIGDGDTGFRSSGDGELLAVSNGTDIMSFRNQSVGIGVAIPTTVLDVRGNFRIDRDATYDVWLQGGGDASGNGRNLALLGEKASDRLILNHAGEYTGGTRFDGTVSIGNNASAALLDVGTGAPHNGNGGFKIMSTGTSAAGLAANVGYRSVYLYASTTETKLDAYDYETDTPLDVGIASNGGNVGIGTSNPASKLDVAGRITRHGHAMSASGTASHGDIITVPWGTRDDWSIFVSVNSMGIDETGSLGDNAMMMIRCYTSVAAVDKWEVHAQYLYRMSSDNSSGAWHSGTANYMLVAK